MNVKDFLEWLSREYDIDFRRWSWESHEFERIAFEEIDARLAEYEKLNEGKE